MDATQRKAERYALRARLRPNTLHEWLDSVAPVHQHCDFDQTVWLGEDLPPHTNCLREEGDGAVIYIIYWDRICLMFRPECTATLMNYREGVRQVSVHATLAEALASLYPLLNS